MNISSNSRCKVCREPIAKDAIKCKECGSFQNWFRHLDVVVQSEASLALIVSIVSLTTSFYSLYSLINYALIPNKHKIYAHFNTVGSGVEAQTEKTLAYYVWKEGREPASIHKVSLVYQINNQPEIPVDLYADRTSLLGFLEHDQKGEIFLRVVNPKKINFFELNRIVPTQIICKVTMTSFGMKEGIDKEFLTEEIKSDHCLDFLKSYAPLASQNLPK